MFLQAWLFIQPPLVVWKVQASGAPHIPTVHKHINTTWAHNAGLLIDRNPKFLRWKCLCSPSAATQWARLSGVSWRRCERRPSLIPHIAEWRRWPWQEAIKNVLQRAHVYVPSPWYTKTLSSVPKILFQFKASNLKLKEGKKWEIIAIKTANKSLLYLSVIYLDLGLQLKMIKVLSLKTPQKISFI